MLWIGAFVHFNKSELRTLQCSFVEAWLFFLTAAKNRNIFLIPFAVFCIDLRVLWHVIRFFWDRCKIHPNCFYVFGHSSKRPRTQRQRQKITIDALKQFDTNAIACGVAKKSYAILLVESSEFVAKKLKRERKCSKQVFDLQLRRQWRKFKDWIEKWRLFNSRLHWDAYKKSSF